MSDPTPGPASLLEYYRRNAFNPVPIELGAAGEWEAHRAKRVNLYQAHLGIPPYLLRGRAVLELGCNSGENALVLASFGAELTLAEPNTQVWPRLRALFDRAGLAEQIRLLTEHGIDELPVDRAYDLVVAEGFVFTLPNRDEAVQKIGRLLAPGGFGTISFIDRYGVLLELVKRMLLWRVCQLDGDAELHGETSLRWSRRLFGADFARLSASRPFEAWWKDTLVNPFVGGRNLWTYADLLRQLARAGCSFHGSSPRWALTDHYRWYKDVPDPSTQHERLLDDWAAAFPYFLTGLPPSAPWAPAPVDAIAAADALVDALSSYTAATSPAGQPPPYPDALAAYLDSAGDASQRLSMELSAVFDAVGRADPEAIAAAYLGGSVLRGSWGTPYHYVSFTKTADR